MELWAYQQAWNPPRSHPRAGPPHPSGQGCRESCYITYTARWGLHTEYAHMIPRSPCCIRGECIIKPQVRGGWGCPGGEPRAWLAHVWLMARPDHQAPTWPLAPCTSARSVTGQAVCRHWRWALRDLPLAVYIREYSNKGLLQWVVKRRPTVARLVLHATSPRRWRWRCYTPCRRWCARPAAAHVHAACSPKRYFLYARPCSKCTVGKG